MKLFWTTDAGVEGFPYWIAPRVKKVVGLEITPEMIDLAERKSNS